MNVRIIERKPDVHTAPPITCATPCGSTFFDGISYASSRDAAVQAGWRTDVGRLFRCPSCVAARVPVPGLYVSEDGLADWLRALEDPDGIHVALGGPEAVPPAAEAEPAREEEAADRYAEAQSDAQALLARWAPDVRLPEDEPEPGETAGPGAEDVPGEPEVAPEPEVDDPALDQAPGPVDVMASFVPMQERTEDAPAFTEDGTAVIPAATAETEMVPVVDEAGGEVT